MPADDSGWHKTADTLGPELLLRSALRLLCAKSGLPLPRRTQGYLAAMNRSLSTQSGPLGLGLVPNNVGVLAPRECPASNVLDSTESYEEQQGFSGDNARTPSWVQLKSFGDPICRYNWSQPNPLSCIRNIVTMSMSSQCPMSTMSTISPIENYLSVWI